jgi:hypothetical protein
VGLAGLARLWAPGDDAGGEQPATAPRSGHRGAGEDDPYRSFHSRLEQALLAEAMAEGIEVVP